MISAILEAAIGLLLLAAIVLRYIQIQKFDIVRNI